MRFHRYQKASHIQHTPSQEDIIASIFVILNSSDLRRRKGWGDYTSNWVPPYPTSLRITVITRILAS